MNTDTTTNLKETELLIQAMSYCDNVQRHEQISKIAKEILDSIDIDTTGKKIWLSTKLINFGDNEIYSKVDVEKKLIEKLKASAELGCMEAEYEYGCILYENGQFDNALRLIKHSAELGYSPAQWSYGLNCLNGIYVPKDIKSAKYFIRLSAEQRYLLAVEFMCESYSFGKNSFPIDLDEAEKWKKISALCEF